MAEDDPHAFAEIRASLEALRDSVERLDERVRRLEGATQAEGTPTGAAPASSTARAPLPPHRRRAGTPPRPPRSGPGPADRLLKGARDFLSEGNPLNKLGALSMILGAGIVFKYAVDNDWIGPTGRVVLGLLTGATLLAAGEIFARRDWKRFAAGLGSAGNGVIFVAVWFGQQQYHVVPPPLAFAIYVSVTAFVVAQSLRYDSLPLALWGLLGGYLTPALASTGSGNYVFLSSYLLVLNAGVFTIAVRRSWRPLEWMAFAITLLYTTVWVIDYAEHPGASRWLALRWVLPFLAAFFVSFAAIPTWRSLWRREPIDAFGQILTIGNGIAHFGLAVAVLHDEHRAWLGLVAGLVASLYAVVASRLTRAATVDAAGLRAFAGTAAGFLLLATPYLATSHWITLVWCGETLLLAWGCTQPRFAFLRLHVLAMLAIVLVRLVAWDGIFERGWVYDGPSYLPFTELRSWPPFAVAATFAGVAWLTGRSAQARLPGGLGWLLALAALVLVAAVDGETSRLARYSLVPLASPDLQDLVRTGLLVFLVSALWLAIAIRLPEPLRWVVSLAFAAPLLAWAFEALVWARGYGHASHILAVDGGLGWLHAGVLLMAPLLLLLGRLALDAPERALGLSRAQLQTLLFGVALVVAMLLLRREVFAVTHAPPLADLIPDGARRATYRSVLSVSYALLAFGIYVTAIRRHLRAGLHAAYALYVFTAFKVYLFDLESQNQLYRASSLIIFAAILFVSSWYANRRPEVEARTAEPHA